ncbi:unnamed protein product [Rhizophagus irregularis]|nr:unnamed protein product [Rhizophagus irregularis]
MAETATLTTNRTRYPPNYNIDHIHVLSVTNSPDLEKAKEKDAQELALYSGTTPKHMINRWRVVDNATVFNNTYHRVMTAHRKSSLQRSSAKKINDTLKMEMDNFAMAHPKAILDHSRHSYKYANEGSTSEDTKNID